MDNRVLGSLAAFVDVADVTPTSPNQRTGDIVGGGDDYVGPWKLPMEGAPARLHELYVLHHDNEPGWGWVVWFALTPDGERVAQEMETKGDTS
jgi:hypothetical protein